MGARLARAAPPAAAILLAAPFTATGARGVFQADLVGLVVAAAVGGFAVRRAHLVALPAMGVLCALAHVVVSGGLAGAAACGLLAFGVSAAAAGLAALGRALGAPSLTAGAAANSVLWLGMTGLFWADPLAATMAPAARYDFRQAVLHVDASTALAYGAAGHDRLHEAHVYRTVPLASSVVSVPSAWGTGLLWLLVGLGAWGVARCLRVGPPTPGVP